MLLTYLWITHRLPPRDKFFNYIRTEQLRTGQETWDCWLNVQRSQGNVALWICSSKSQVILDHGWNVGHYIRLYRIYSKERQKGSVLDVIYYLTGTARYTQKKRQMKTVLNNFTFQHCQFCFVRMMWKISNFSPQPQEQISSTGRRYDIDCEVIRDMHFAARSSFW